MKFLMTLIALLLLTAACTPKEPMATVEESCSIADRLVAGFVSVRDRHSLQELRSMFREGPTPEWFWEPLVMRVYAEPKENIKGSGSYLDRTMRVLEFRNKLTMECHEEGVQLTREQITLYYEATAAIEQANLAKQQKNNE